MITHDAGGPFFVTTTRSHHPGNDSKSLTTPDCGGAERPILRCAGPFAGLPSARIGGSACGYPGLFASSAA